jgi:DNA-directed RNA polymerase sigma subunit (sigma70/sigma32)
MNGFACLEEEVLLDVYGSEVAGVGHLPASAGTFSLRRAQYLTESGKLPLSAEQQRALLRLVHESDPVAKQRIIAGNLRLVVDIAKHYTHWGVPLFDLIREGNPGLIYALERSDAEGRFCVSTYAARYIRQSIEYALMSRSAHEDTPLNTQEHLHTFNHIASGGRDVHPA